MLRYLYRKRLGSKIAWANRKGVTGSMVKTDGFMHYTTYEFGETIRDRRWKRKRKQIILGYRYIDIYLRAWEMTATSRIYLIFLTFMGLCIVNIFQYISNKMQRYTVYLYLKTALHISGVTSTHHQEGIQMYLQHLVFVTPLLLPAAKAADSSWQIPDAVDTVVCPRDDGLWYHP